MLAVGAAPGVTNANQSYQDACIRYYRLVAPGLLPTYSLSLLRHPEGRQEGGQRAAAAGGAARPARTRRRRAQTHYTIYLTGLPPDLANKYLYGKGTAV